MAVLVGTCPDLGTVKPIPPPLKQVARTWSRRVAAAQTIAVLEGGGRTVSLGSVLGPEFAAAPALLFGPDQFHPSAAGYRSLAAVLVPSMLAALGLIPEDEAAPEALRGEGVLPITTAALQAVNIPGTELDGTEVAGRTRGVRGLWVELRHRRRQPQPEGEAPGEDEEPTRTRASGGYHLGMTETQREPVPRVDTSEKDTALAFLRFARHCLVKKTEGLDDEQLRRVLVPSGTSLLGLVQHVTDGERWWFGYHVAGDPQWSEVDFSMEVPPDRPSGGGVRRLRRGGGRQRGDHGRRLRPRCPARRLVDGEQLSVRWVVAHKTSEIARHAGHADILRELIDGVTGR